MEFATREDEQDWEWEGRRHALAALLQARGFAHAAAIVAMSEYRTDYAGDNCYDVTLAVPPHLYDRVRTNHNDEIRDACLDIVGADQFGSVIFRVATPPYRTDWIEAIIDSLPREWVASERVCQGEIEAAPCAS